MNKKIYVDVLTKQAEKSGHAHDMALSDFLDYLLDLFDANKYDTDLTKYVDRLNEKLHENMNFGGLAIQWMADVSEAMDRGEWLDVFGELYEEMYLTRGKASRTGQFFTPKSLSDLMAEIIDPAKNQAPGAKNEAPGKAKELPAFRVNGYQVNDCAAGSGRLLLAHYIDVSKVDHSRGRGYYYIAQDSDPIACKMAALNMMIHGMNAKVICQDTLTLDAPKVIYYINEVRYPFATPYYSVRTI